MRITHPSKKSECGVTILIVGITLLALVAMAALAIDVATLYQARGEAQRAADAAALAGAKMFVSSSFTSRPSVWDFSTICEDSPSSTAAVNQQAALAAQENLIAGQPAVIQAIHCNLDSAHGNTNPQITVTVARTGTPAFFSRIWRPDGNTITAKAVAEAYRPSEQNPLPLEITGVRPFLVSNCDPTNIVGSGSGNPNCPAGGSNHYDFFIKSDGSLANSGSFIGKKFCFRRVGVPIGPPVDMQTFPSAPNPPVCPYPIIRYYGMNLPIDYPTSSCPSTSPSGCDNVGSNQFTSNIACTSSFKFRCNQPIAHGTPVSVRIDNSIGDGSREGGRCLIHASDQGLNNGQDIFTPSAANDVPMTTVGGSGNPNSSLAGKHISRSDSIVTVPVYDAENLCPSGNCNLGNSKLPNGFLQIAITQTFEFPQHFEAIIVNASGCNPSPSGTPMTSDGSPVAVRLIQAP